MEDLGAVPLDVGFRRPGVSRLWRSEGVVVQFVAHAMADLRRGDVVVSHLDVVVGRQPEDAQAWASSGLSLIHI